MVFWLISERFIVRWEMILGCFSFKCVIWLKPPFVPPACVSHAILIEIKWKLANCPNALSVHVFVFLKICFFFFKIFLYCLLFFRYTIDSPLRQVYFYSIVRRTEFYLEFKFKSSWLHLQRLWYLDFCRAYIAAVLARDICVAYFVDLKKHRLKKIAC